MRPPKPWQRRFYKSRAWQDCRRVVWERQNGLCADCLERGELTPIDEVHHLVELNEHNVCDPHVSLNPALCVGLCRNCHNRRHEKGYKSKGNPTRVWFDEQGRPMRREIEL
jgi:5-methylcytosine-specific restriction endonuclease McrA